MDPQARDIIQNVLDSYIPSRTHTGDPNFNPQDQGRYAGKDVPDTTIQFQARLADSVSSFVYNKWTLDELDKITLIENAMLIYKGYYADWVNKPLDGDAPPAVVAWQATAKKTGI